jgi:predicted alpha/beta hydrolase
MNTPTILSETFQLPALDGYPLTATLYNAPEPVAQLLIAGATGVPQGFYRRFAEYAAQRG